MSLLIAKGLPGSACSLGLSLRQRLILRWWLVGNSSGSVWQTRQRPAHPGIRPEIPAPHPPFHQLADWGLQLLLQSLSRALTSVPRS